MQCGPLPIEFSFAFANLYTFHVGSNSGKGWRLAHYLAPINCKFMALSRILNPRVRYPQLCSIEGQIHMYEGKKPNIPKPAIKIFQFESV
jgi:hypothetical protein